MALAFVVLAYTGILTLGYVRGPRWLRWLGRLLCALVALGFSALALALYQVGEDRAWGGEGPAMLVVMLGLGAAALCAFSAWIALIVQLFGLGPANAASPRTGLAMLAIGLTGSFHGAVAYRLEGKPAHDAPIVALRLLEGGGGLLSLDGAGTLKRWRLPSGALEETRSFESLAATQGTLLSRDGRFALVIEADGARIASLEVGGATPQKPPGVTHAALIGGGAAALAEGSNLRVVSLASPHEARERLALPADVSALACDAQGRLALALDDGRLLAAEPGAGVAREIARLPAPAARLLVSPGGSWWVAIEAGGKALVLDTQSGVLRSLADGMRIERGAFVSEDALFFHGPGDPAALRLALPQLESEPWFNHGSAANALDVAPGASDAAVALGAELLLIPARASGNAYTSESTRLVDRRW